MSKDGKVISLAERAESSLLWSPEDALREALRDFEEGGRWEGRKKLLVLSLDEDGGTYNVGFTNAGFNASELLALLTIAKRVIEKDMGY